MNYLRELNIKFDKPRSYQVKKKFKTDLALKASIRNNNQTLEEEIGIDPYQVSQEGGNFY